MFMRFIRIFTVGKFPSQICQISKETRINFTKKEVIYLSIIKMDIHLVIGNKNDLNIVSVQDHSLLKNYSVFFISWNA